MPLYEYQCQSCSEVTEVIQKFSDDPLVICPQCNESSLKKLVSAPRFRLAGSGWYETDFKNDKQRNLASSDSEEKSSSKSSDKPVNKTDGNDKTSNTKSTDSSSSSTSSSNKTLET